MNILDDKVLLLNRLMQAVRLISVRKAFFLMAKPRRKDPRTRVATALEVNDNHEIERAVTWEEWITLPIRPEDRVIHTSRCGIRVPSIIVLAEFDKTVIVEPNLNKKTLWKRQDGKCMYTLVPLEWGECDMDHYIAKSAGGKTEWTNCGLTTMVINRKKGSKKAHEVGLSLKLPLVKPKSKPLAIDSLRPDLRFPEWDMYM